MNHLSKILFTLILTIVTFNFSYSQKKIEVRAKKIIEVKIIKRIQNTNPDLNLTEEQMNELVAYKVEDLKAIKQIEKSEKTNEEKKAAKKEIYATFFPKIKSVLTKEQLSAWKDGKTFLHD